MNARESLHRWIDTLPDWVVDDLWKQVQTHPEPFANLQQWIDAAADLRREITAASHSLSDALSALSETREERLDDLLGRR